MVTIGILTGEVGCKASCDDDGRQVGKKAKNVQFSATSEERLFHLESEMSIPTSTDSEFDVQNRVTHKIRRLTPSRNPTSESAMDEGVERTTMLSVPTKTFDGIFQHRSGAQEPDPELRSLPYKEFWWCQPSKVLSLDSLLLDSRAIIQVQGRDLYDLRKHDEHADMFVE